jgi:ParB family chromosome partitioning protein
MTVVSLAAVIHGLALDVFYPGCSSDSCVRLIVRSAHASRAIATPDSCRALAATSREHERLRDRLPGDPAELWEWLLTCSRDEPLRLLAYIAAIAVDAAQLKGERRDSARLAHANRLSMLASTAVCCENRSGPTWFRRIEA